MKRREKCNLLIAERLAVSQEAATMKTWVLPSIAYWSHSKATRLLLPVETYEHTQQHSMDIVLSALPKGFSRNFIQ
jgi:hypothetical protein